MALNSNDLLWPHFAPLWDTLGNDGVTSLTVAGGYGLYLKQEYAKAHPEMQTVIPLPQWQDAASRVTKDVDIVLGLDLMANENQQSVLSRVLKENGFTVTERNPRWQFRKEISESRSVIVEFHAKRAPADAPNLDADDYRIKHKPSLGEKGVHSLTNPEAVGCDLDPFSMVIDGLRVLVPNPITWAIMKLAAMNDRWEDAQSSNRTDESREFARLQAFKHAHDIGRIVALVTRDERDICGNVVQSLVSTPEFLTATEIANRLQLGELPLIAQWERTWGLADRQTLLQILASWFR